MRFRDSTGLPPCDTGLAAERLPTVTYTHAHTIPAHAGSVGGTRTDLAGQLLRLSTTHHIYYYTVAADTAANTCYTLLPCLLNSARDEPWTLRSSACVGFLHRRRTAVTVGHYLLGIPGYSCHVHSNLHHETRACLPYLFPDAGSDGYWWTVVPTTLTARCHRPPHRVYRRRHAPSTDGPEYLPTLPFSWLVVIPFPQLIGPVFLPLVCVAAFLDGLVAVTCPTYNPPHYHYYHLQSFYSNWYTLADRWTHRRFVRITHNTLPSATPHPLAHFRTTVTRLAERRLLKTTPTCASPCTTQLDSLTLTARLRSRILPSRHDHTHMPD